MKKGSRFLIGLATAGITFGTLMLTLGPGHFNRFGHRHHGCYHNYENNCGVPSAEKCETINIRTPLRN